MTSIAVTGAAGAVGLRVVRQLAADPVVQRVVAIDRQSVDAPWPGVETLQVDLFSDEGVDELAADLGDIDSVVHLAERASGRDDVDLATRLLRRALEVADGVGCRHVVVLSSATVYGAHADNAVPLVESEPPRPVAELSFAVAKYALEGVAREWEAGGEGRTVAILRPTTTLSERGSGWIARALRAATTVRPDQADPPVQFLHHDDLASAVSFVARRRLSGVFNVAPDGWIGPEAFHDLVGGVEVRVPVAVNDRILAAGRRIGFRPVPPGIEHYVRFPWVVANDRLRTAGWTPAFSNEEAYVLGTPAPAWAVSAQRRQELALGAVGVAVAGAAAVGAAIARRLSR